MRTGIEKLKFDTIVVIGMMKVGGILRDTGGPMKNIEKRKKKNIVTKGEVISKRVSTT